MPRTGAKVTQADIARVLRAVKQSGLSMRIEISTNGNIVLDPAPASTGGAIDRRTPVDL
jgi:hypothetical protein